MAKIVNIPSNVNYKSDTIYALIWIRWILRILGIWPLVYPDTSIIEKILGIISFALCWSGLSFLLIPMIIFVLSDQSTINEKVKLIGPLSYVIISMLKYFLLIVHYKGIRRCIHILSVDWNVIQQEDHRKIMIRNTTKGHMLSKFCIVFMYCGGLCFHTVMPFLSRTSEGQGNVTIGPIPYPSFNIVFNLHVKSVYLIIYFAQCCSGIVQFNVTTAVCCLAATLIFHVCGQMEIIMSRIENFVKDTRNNCANSKQYMAIIVRHHMHALRFSARIQNVLSEICLVEIVMSALIICSLEYYCLMEWANKNGAAILTYSFLFLSFVFNVFTLCYISEQLTEQCSKIGHALYEIEWYYLPRKIALDLILMIHMSHQPKQLSAEKLINLSFSSFGNVMKMSIAYLNLLRTFI